MKRSIRWLAGLGAIALVLTLGVAFAACGGSDGSSTAADTAADEAEHVEADEALDGDEAAHVEGDDALHEDEAAHQDDAALVDGDQHAVDGDVQEVTVAVRDLFNYDPAEITVTAGEAVRITLDNSASPILHDFTIEGLAAPDVNSDGAGHAHGEAAADSQDEDGSDDVAVLHVAAESGESGVLEFTPAEAGVYQFFCTVPGHREAGMEGTLIVS